MSIKQVKIVKTPNVTETLKNIGIGEKVVASKTTLSINAVRAAASRLKDEGLEFVVEDESLTTRFYITRNQ